MHIKKITDFYLFYFSYLLPLYNVIQDTCGFSVSVGEPVENLPTSISKQVLTPIMRMVAMGRAILDYHTLPPVYFEIDLIFTLSGFNSHNAVLAKERSSL